MFVDMVKYEDDATIVESEANIVLTKLTDWPKLRKKIKRLTGTRIKQE